MGSVKITLFGETLNRLNQLIKKFEDARNLSGILKIIALKRISAGDSIETVADTLRVTGECIRSWVHAFLASGIDFLTPKTSPGRPKILANSEEKQLVRLIKKSPEESGFRGGCWDSKKIRQLIQKLFGKKISLKYLPEYLKSLGFSFKKARFEIHREKNKIRREQWIEEVWPAILRTSDKQDAHILFGDEAHFSIFGTPGYTWTLTGEETIIDSTGSKKSLHAIGAIDYRTGNTHAYLTDEKIDGCIFIGFLKIILKETRKPIHLIIDNAAYHRSAEVQAFLLNHKKRITIHYLPPYSPDYNPIEGLWKKIKKETTHNVYFETLEELQGCLVSQFQWFRKNKSEIKSLFGFYENQILE
jgi:transposase